MGDRDKVRSKIIDSTLDRAEQLAKLYGIAEDKETLKRITHWVDADISSRLELEELRKVSNSDKEIMTLLIKAYREVGFKNVPRPERN